VSGAGSLSWLLWSLAVVLALTLAGLVWCRLRWKCEVVSTTEARGALDLGASSSPIRLPISGRSLVSSAPRSPLSAGSSASALQDETLSVWQPRRRV
jgi:hypothetical protein